MQKALGKNQELFVYLGQYYLPTVSKLGVNGKQLALLLAKNVGVKTASPAVTVDAAIVILQFAAAGQSFNLALLDACQTLAAVVDKAAELFTYVTPAGGA